MKYYTMNSEQHQIKQFNDNGTPKLDKDKQPVMQEITIAYIKRDSDKAMIPCVEANPDYIAYLADKDKEVVPYDYEAEVVGAKLVSDKITEETDREKLIQAKIREIAIKELVAEGKIDESKR